MDVIKNILCKVRKLKKILVFALLLRNICIIVAYIVRFYCVIEAVDFLYLNVIMKKIINNSVEDGGQLSSKFRIQTFGNFEVFLDDKPLVFRRTKTKELLAYLVSRQGALCNNNEIIAIIWENKEDSPSLKSMFRTLVADLLQTLSAAGICDIIIKHRGHIGIIKEKISCDLFDFLTGINTKSYMGEYMTQYSWAENTNLYLRTYINSF